MKILIILNNAETQQKLISMLSGHEVTIVDSGELAISKSEEGYNLIILDSKLPGIDGYETSHRLRNIKQTQDAIILFLSSFATLEDRMKAYSMGGDDYLPIPFDINELQAKIEIYEKTFMLVQKTTQELEVASCIIKDTQTSASKLQSISRFIHSSLFCNDIDSLFKLFFRTAKEIDINCVLQVKSSEGVEARSSTGRISELENEILTIVKSVDRIQTFGDDRAIYNWDQATLLTRTVGDMIDTLAIFMDSLTAAIKAIDKDAILLQKAKMVGEQNTVVRNRVDELFGRLNADLQSAILSLGLVSALDYEDEEKLNELLSSYHGVIDTELSSLEENNSSMLGLINELKESPVEIDEFSYEDEMNNGGVILF